MSDMPRIAKDEGFVGTVTPAKAKKIEETLDVMSGKDSDKTEPLSAEAAYAAGLKARDVSLEDARTIMENMFVRGFHEEEVYLGANTYITLRTRQYYDTIRANRKLEADRVEFVNSIQDIVNRYNAAASLVRYGDHVFNVPSPLNEVDMVALEASFTKRLDFIEKLPAPVAIRVMQKVFEFDQKMYAVMADGAPKDF